MRRNPIHTLVSDSDTKASKSDTKNVDEIVTFIQKLITGARTKRTGCFILPLATLAFGEPTSSLGSLPNIIPERHNAIVTVGFSGMWKIASLIVGLNAGGHRPHTAQSSSATSDMWASYTRCRPVLACGK